ncbi:MAG: hypothetical protein IJC84_00435 [Clostridia bacterium]|nr:hypothetical protein [Clostridia bacterium]
MAEEKIIPEAEEAKVEKTEKKKGKGGLLGIIIAAAVVVVAIIALVIVAIVSDSGAVAAYKEGVDLKKQEQAGYEELFEEAYAKSRWALFMGKDNKNTILEQYILEVLCKSGRYFEAADLLEDADMSEAKKKTIYAQNSELGMCKKGSIVTFGTLEQDGDLTTLNEPLEWIVLDVVEVDGKMQALLMTKNVVGELTNGYAPVTGGNDTSYAKSGLHAYCESFVEKLIQADQSMRGKFVQTTITTAASSDGSSSGADVKAYGFAPSKEDLDKYMTGDLAQYVKASATANAKKNGVTARGADRWAGYFLRNSGNVVDNQQRASSIGQDGAFYEDTIRNSTTVGARVCVVVNLGTK